MGEPFSLCVGFNYPYPPHSRTEEMTKTSENKPAARNTGTKWDQLSPSYLLIEAF
jgi:hypothetical protein